MYIHFPRTKVHSNDQRAVVQLGVIALAGWNITKEPGVGIRRSRCGYSFNL